MIQLSRESLGPSRVSRQLFCSGRLSLPLIRMQARMVTTVLWLRCCWRDTCRYVGTRHWWPYCMTRKISTGSSLSTKWKDLSIGIPECHSFRSNSSGWEFST